MAHVLKVRGFPDHFAAAIARRRFLLEEAYSLASCFGFEPVEAPIVERSELFKRAMALSAAVQKEMYCLEGGELALRPEGTAGLVRMLIEEKPPLPCRWICSGPMFRHERPQKGRFRQFHQVSAEIFGEEGGDSDAELIFFAVSFLKNIGVYDKASLQLNCIGESQERANYIQKLIQFLKPIKNRLSAESQERLLRNPLRILDSKSASDQELLQKAPLISESLGRESQGRFQSALRTLKSLGVSFQENPFLVRGLDYYNGMVFEIKAEGLGAQDAILAGGRYDSLVEDLGGRCAPALGFAAGLERLALLLPERPPPPPPHFAVAASKGRPQEEAFKNALLLRARGFRVFFKFQGSFAKQMAKAAASGALKALIFGEREIAEKKVTVKDLKTRKEEAVLWSAFEKTLPPCGPRLSKKRLSGI